MQYLAPLYPGARAAPTPVYAPTSGENRTSITGSALLQYPLYIPVCYSDTACPHRTQSSLHIPPQDGFKLHVSKVLGNIRTANTGARNKQTQDHTPSNPPQQSFAGPQEWQNLIRSAQFPSLPQHMQRSKLTFGFLQRTADRLERLRAAPLPQTPSPPSWAAGRLC